MDVVIEQGKIYQAVAYDEKGAQVSRCAISAANGVWQISSWYTRRDAHHQGYGKKCMAALVEHLLSHEGRPIGVEYIWNGENSYVHEWMERHFSPVSKCPLAVQKYAAEDDWESHIYKLDTASFLSYFEEMEKEKGDSHER